MKRKKIYISGPITHCAGYRKAFKRAETYLRHKGFHPVNPARFTLFGKSLNGRSWHVCMAVCLWHLLWCHSVYMLKGWTNSQGAKIERRVAILLNKRILYQN